MEITLNIWWLVAAGVILSLPAAFRRVKAAYKAGQRAVSNHRGLNFGGWTTGPLPVRCDGLAVKLDPEHNELHLRLSDPGGVEWSKVLNVVTNPRLYKAALLPTIGKLGPERFLGLANLVGNATEVTRVMEEVVRERAEQDDPPETTDSDTPEPAYAGPTSSVRRNRRLEL